jgi:hypothetical protein
VVPVNIKNVKYGYRVYVTPIIPQGPYKDAAISIPGKVEAENYDVGGVGKAYFDKDDENKGKEYREDAVDVVKAGDGYAIGYTQEGEWLEYTVNVAKEQDYVLTVRYATKSENAGVKLYVDDVAVTEDIIVPQGNDWDTYAVHDAGLVKLPKGEHILKMEILGNYVNIDWLNFEDTSHVAGAATDSTAEKVGIAKKDSTGTPEKEPAALHALRFATTSSSYLVFDMQGRLVSKISATGAEELQAKTNAAVKCSGTYLVKPLRGGQIMRITVR